MFAWIYQGQEGGFHWLPPVRYRMAFQEALRRGAKRFWATPRSLHGMDPRQLMTVGKTRLLWEEGDLICQCGIPASGVDKLTKEPYCQGCAAVLGYVELEDLPEEAAAS